MPPSRCFHPSFSLSRLASSSRSNVPFLWRTIRVCPRDRFYFAPCHLSCPVTVEHCFLWRSMLDVPIALRFSRYFLLHPLSLSLSLSDLPRVSTLVSSSSFYVRNRGIKKKEMEKSKWVFRDHRRSRRRLPEQMLSQFIFDDAKSSPLPPHRSRSRIGNRSTFLLDVRRLVVAPFPLEFEKKRKKFQREKLVRHESNESSKDDLASRYVKKNT